MPAGSPRESPVQSIDIVQLLAESGQDIARLLGIKTMGLEQIAVSQGLNHVMYQAEILERRLPKVGVESPTPCIHQYVLACRLARELAGNEAYRFQNDHCNKHPRRLKYE